MLPSLFRIACLVILLLTGCVPRTIDASANAPVVPSPALDTGCLGTEMLACVDVLKSQLQIRDTLPGEIDKEVQEQLANNNAVDVNGRSLNRARKLELWMETRPYVRRRIVIGYDRANIVTSIQAEVPGDPVSSQTVADYDETGILPFLRIICGTPCDDVSADIFYKFFENQVKPHLHFARDRRQRLRVQSYRNYSSVEYLAWSDPLSFHGMRFQYAYVATNGLRFRSIILSK